MLRFIEDGTAIVFGGFSENVLIAYAWGYLRKSEEDRKRMHITQIVVSEQYRDQGIGRRLLANMQEYAKEKNWYGMELNVHRQNYNARKFYERNGFICEKLFLIKNHIKTLESTVKFFVGGIDMYLIDGNLILRAMEREDNELLKTMINSPEIERNVVGWSAPSSNEKQMTWYENIMSSDTDIKYIIEVEKKAVGMAAITQIDFKNSNADLNIKIANGNDKRKGIGYRTIKLLKKYVFEELNLHCLTADIIEDNAASRGLFEKSGFQLEGICRNRVYKGGVYHNLCKYSILKEEYLRGDKQ